MSVQVLSTNGRYEMRRTEQTPNGLATYHGEDFRTYEPREFVAADGRMILMQLCEALIEGRWEGFYSLVER